MQTVRLLGESAEAALAAGNIGEAEGLFRKIIGLDPRQAAAHAGLGAVAGLRGEHRLGAESLAKACELESSNPMFLHNYAESLRQLGRNGEAEPLFRKVISIDPHFIPSYDSLISLLQLNRLQAEQQKQLSYGDMLSRELAILSSNQGNAWLDIGELPKATAAYRRALEFFPGYVTALSNLANALRSEGRICEGEDAGRQAVAIDPSFAPAWNNLGNALAEEGRLDEATRCFDRALALRPGFPEARHNRGSGLLMNYIYDHEIAEEELFDMHRRWGESYPLPEGWKRRPIEAAGRPLRIGYLSPDFRMHAMLHFLEPILAHHDPAQFEVVCYAECPAQDEHSRRLMTYSHSWVRTHELDDAALAAKIESDRIDLLVDCAGHTRGGRLEALAGKPAPVMLSWMGYLGTTGLPAMDFRLTDIWADPPGIAEGQHTERLLRIPEGMMAYRPHSSCPEVGALPAASTGAITFASLNNIRKMNAQVVELWSGILKAVPGSRLLLQSGHLADAGTRGRLTGLFEAFGIRPDRIEMRKSSADFLQTYLEADIALDPMPYGGGATTCDALWMGVPVVTLSGSRPAGRLSTSILHQIGHPEWIASNLGKYVELACALAAERDRLALIRKGLRETMRSSSLCDEAGFVRRLEKIYREVAG
ncbi:MAG: tetratricopeptide repeat protein [Chlorobiaceae bacterium]